MEKGKERKKGVNELEKESPDSRFETCVGMKN